MIQEMKNNALAKAKSRKGFTLAELLIVVAIIAILIAIAIPLFAGQLDNAKKATDDANARSAKAVMIAIQMDDTELGNVTSPSYFNAKSGEFEGAKTNAYKSQTEDTTADPSRGKEQYLTLTKDANDELSLAWGA